jgi:hypothetical protein
VVNLGFLQERKPMNWTEIRQQLKAAPNEVLLDMIKGLYGLSAENKAYLRTTLSPARQDLELLEKSRRQVLRAIYPENTQNPHMPHFRKPVPQGRQDRLGLWR